MGERYRLVFRGEVLDGHHAAVVRKKLGAALGIKEDAKLAALFAGKPVVIRKDADTKTAAKFQAAFKKSGARLRVLPVVLSIEELEAQEVEAQRLAAEQAAERERAAALAARPDQADFSDSSAWVVMPHGSPVLADEEREEVAPVEVPTEHISLDTAIKFVADEQPSDRPEPQIQAPEFEVADVGAVLAPSSTAADAAEQVPVLDVEFSIAEPGVALIPPREPVQPPAAAVAVEFDLAEPGAVIGAGASPEQPAPVPDVSHLQLEPAVEPEESAA